MPTIAKFAIRAGEPRVPNCVAKFEDQNRGLRRRFAEIRIGHFSEIDWLEG